MIKLIDLITEAQLSKYQIFSPGTGGKDFGNMKFNPSKIPTGQLKIISMYDRGGDCFNNHMVHFGHHLINKSLKVLLGQNIRNGNFQIGIQVWEQYLK